MEKEQTQTLTWAELVGPCAGEPDYDDNPYGTREALDWRRAQRDGWGADLCWDGK